MMAELVLSHVRPENPLRVLDIGCGNGGHLLELAAALPAASLVGVDVSKSNIDQATLISGRAGFEGRIEFHCSNYMALELDAFDLIISDSALQWIEATSEELLSKISHDLTSEGVLIASMPFLCGYNRMLFVVRRLLRAWRCRFLDSFIFAVARTIHGNDYSDKMLRERLAYMYLIPKRVFSSRLTAIAQKCSLRLIDTLPERRASYAQPKHMSSIWRRETDTTIDAVSN